MAGLCASIESMKELWIGVAEVLTDAASGEGHTRAFTNVVTWATSAEDYCSTVTHVLAKYDWAVLGTENTRPISDEAGFNEELAEVIERARMNPNACIFATLHYYPSKPS
jgi:hypothetical protein